MPEIVYTLIGLGVLVGGGFLSWNLHQTEQKRRKEKEQRKQELKMSRHIPTIIAKHKIEKERLKHEREIAALMLKKEKAQLNHELQKEGIDTTRDKAIKIIPESLGHVAGVVKSFSKPLSLINKKED